MDVKRDKNGRLLPGSTANPNGRAPREREAAYLLIMKEVVGAKEFRTLWQEAYLGARGKKIAHVKNVDNDKTEPQLIDDTDSTPGTRLAYLRFIQENLIGKPIERVLVDEGGGEVLEDYQKLRDDELHAVMNVAEEKGEAILREARRLARKGMANKTRRNHSGGTDGDTSNEAATSKQSA